MKTKLNFEFGDLVVDCTASRYVDFTCIPNWPLLSLKIQLKSIYSKSYNSYLDVSRLDKNLHDRIITEIHRIYR